MPGDTLAERINTLSAALDSCHDLIACANGQCKLIAQVCPKGGS